MLTTKRPFFIRCASDRGRGIVVPATENLRIAFETLNPLISFHSDLDLGDAAVLPAGLNPFTIHLLDGRSNDHHDFVFARHDRSGTIYIGSIVDSDSPNPAELLRVAMFRMAAGMLDVVSAGDEHVIPHCAMQPIRNPVELKFLAGVSVPLCSHCQDRVSSFDPNM